MGVTGLWQIVQPCARPIKIETLNRRRLAVDASIWIYQFLKAVRDKDGNALRNSHVVGFFRRICKLLFFGIKPVFVFDGGAPALKRATIAARKSRREGRREDAARTAGKLLAVQMQRRAEEEEAEQRRRRQAAAASSAMGSNNEPEEEEDGDAAANNGTTAPVAYVDEIFQTPEQRQANRKFRKTDAYHLPELDVSLSEMGGAADPRIMSLEELEAYARQFETGEDVSVYDFSKIDYDSAFFQSLPPSDRYNILNAARLRSRLRMGHSKEQLDTMFPDRMAFSRFQIERVRERNELTQRLMHLNGFQDGLDFGGRVAGEKGREYVLVKNDGVEGGWALGVISDEGRQEKPIDVDKPAVALDENANAEWEDEEEDFEDVPIEGLNRLPKQRQANVVPDDGLTKRRQDFYKSRKPAARRRTKRKEAQDPNSLFVQSDDDAGGDWEEVETNEDEADGDNDEVQSNDDEDLRRAIAMSLQNGNEDEDEPQSSAPHAHTTTSDAEDDDMLEVFQQSAAAEERPLPKGSGRAIASIVNKRAFNAAPESREITSFGVPSQKPDDSDGEDSMDFQAALAESRKTKRKTTPPRPVAPPAKKKASDPTRDIAKEAGFKGPLPFESLDLGSSLLGKKKMQQRTEEAAGGFENPDVGEKKRKATEPLPPWFVGDLEENIKAQKVIEADDRERTKEFNKQFRFQDRGAALRRRETDEVIDLEAEAPSKDFDDGQVIELDADDDDDVDEHDVHDKRLIAVPPIDDHIRMGDMADKVRADPPAPEDISTAPLPLSVENNATTQTLAPAGETPALNTSPDKGLVDTNEHSDDDEVLDWSESDGETQRPKADTTTSPPVENRDQPTDRSSRSPSADFEDVTIPDAPPLPGAPAQRILTPDLALDQDMDGPAPASGLAAQDAIPDGDEFDDFSDPEEQEIIRALTLEAEEHARFASSLNNKTQAQNVEDYERELKKLRTQQKKDRRDADEVTHIMITECQQLLRLFGLPYITAPMEAEAQCAELVSLGLVDGIVTDDSDCFLFGGTRVYKNMFNQAKFVECYLTSDLEKEFDLTRDKLISIAQLLGSDYTEGLPGVGPVTALEIISEFPSLDGFKDWWSGVQLNQIPKTADANHPFRKKFRRNATKLFLPPAFPDARVQIAYTNPEVDADPQPFQWGVPDLDALRAFLMATIGWSQARTDEVLVPVIRDMNRRLDEGTQANITAFFDGGVGVGAAAPAARAAAGQQQSRGEGFAPRKRVAGSKRMGSALSRMAERAKQNRSVTSLGEGNEDRESDDEQGLQEEAEAGSKRRKTRKVTATAREDGDGEDADSGDHEVSDEESADARSSAKAKKAKKTKGRRRR